MRRAMEGPSRRAIRLNPARINLQIASTRLGTPLSPVPFNPQAFWLPADAPSGLGLKPLHAGGGFYVQDAAATAVVPLVDPQPGEWIIDLAAAPGGKATELASRMQGRGVLVANDVNPVRAQALQENLERLGARNAVVTQAPPAELAARWRGRFDAVLLDAPCSGEGMFGKSDAARVEWTPSNVETCALRQDGLLDAAYALLAPGGRLVYATCTLNRDENEGAVERLLARTPDAEAVPITRGAGMEPGVLAEHHDVRVASARIWPDTSFGEGHFMARIRRPGRSASPRATELGRWRPARQVASEHASEAPLEVLARTLQPAAFEALASRVRVQGGAAWVMPASDLALGGLQVRSPGWRIADMLHGRWQPAHALAMGVTADEVLTPLDLGNENLAVRYLRGEELSLNDTAGSAWRNEAWLWVHDRGVPLGWARQRGERIRNLRPKRLRLR
jgi:16S rRNA C967 or C1407 C5-methylase (RsmB/RsmF family)/NOL1/NOP2/fmu family ribosome biogenesis protein